MTAGKDGFLRPIDRDTRQIVYATPVTTIENAGTPVTTQPTHACPGPIGGGVVTYSAQGRQSIAVVSGSPSSFWVDAYPGAPTVVIFALARQ